jgi:hypothetical protein
MKPFISNNHLTTSFPEITTRLIKNDVQKNQKKNYILGENIGLYQNLKLIKKNF